MRFENGKPRGSRRVPEGRNRKVVGRLSGRPTSSWN